MKHQRFKYRTLEDIRSFIQDSSLDLPLSDNINALFQPTELFGKTISNRIAIQPMEGCDGAADGSPQDLTTRRYLRFAAGGASVIWMEAVSILPQARANPRQLMLTEQNVDVFKRLLEQMRTTALQQTGHVPLIVMQATHSGRYAKPNGKNGARILYHSPIYEATSPLDDSCILRDEELQQIEAQFEVSGRLAKEAGFDAMDVKCSHRYLLNEALSAYTRPGPYGGESFENRTRLLRNSLDAAIASGVTVTSRLNLFDGPAYPYGWGVGKDGSQVPDLTEPFKLVELLQSVYGLNALNVTIGNPYFNPHVNRPYDYGAYVPQEHPLEGVARICACTKALKEAYPALTVISSGNSYLRHLSPNLAAGMIESGGTDLVGFGRMAFAYPDFVRDLQTRGQLQEDRCCIACSKCTEMMRMGSVTGCVIRDKDLYGKLYRQIKGR